MNRAWLGGAVALAVLGLAAVSAAATTTTASFNVTATLTSKCEITTSPSDVVFTYTAFQASAAAATGGSFAVRCTNSLPYNLSVDTTSGTVIGLSYTLSVPSTTFTGTGSNVTHTISGSMVSGQAGTCNASSCTGSNAHTLIVTY